jgi:hypothetical protein
LKNAAFFVAFVGGLHQYPLALTGLAQGMYVVVLESENGRYHNRMLRQ